MGRKTNKQKAQDALSKLSKKELKELLSQYANKDDYDEIESKFSIKCPVCECYGWIRKGKTDNGMSVFECKECGKK